MRVRPPSREREEWCVLESVFSLVCRCLACGAGRASLAHPRLAGRRSSPPHLLAVRQTSCLPRALRGTEKMRLLQPFALLALTLPSSRARHRVGSSPLSHSSLQSRSSPLSRTRELCCSLNDDFARRAKESGLLRPDVLRQAEAGTLWDGAVPQPDYSPIEVIELILRALQQNDEPQPHAGTALLRRFSTSDCCLPGEPSAPRLAPQELTAFFASSQYGLLLEPAAYRAAFPSDTVELDDAHAWQEVSLEDDAGNLLAKLGWSLQRRRDGCWVTEHVSWHDFREGWRPGIGEEEWDRSFG